MQISDVGIGKHQLGVQVDEFEPDLRSGNR